MATHMETTVRGDAKAPRTSLRRPPKWMRWAPFAAALCSAAYLVLGIIWQVGKADYPWTDGSTGIAKVNILDGVEQGQAAWLVIGASLTGLALTATMIVLAHRPGRALGMLRVLALCAAGQGAVLAVVVPDFRILAAAGYLPIQIVMTPFVADAGAMWSDYFAWPTVNLIILTLSGAAFLATALSQWRLATCACQRRGRGDEVHQWSTPENAARWGRWSVALAVAIPIGYATTRIAWALDIPLGVSQDLLTELGSQRYAGAALGLLSIGGAALTLGLVRPWGEIWPRWIPRLGGRSAPVGVAVIPASIVSSIVMSAGLMFVRLRVFSAGEIANAFPGEITDTAAWLPEMFWPLWSLSLAAATYAYWLRRRGRCATCGATA